MIDPRNQMHVTVSSYAWFILNLNTKSCYLQITYYSTYTQVLAHVNPAPCFPLPAPSLFTNPLYVTHFLLTWRTSFLAHGVNTYPILPLVCYQLFTLCNFSYPNTFHRSSYNIYIDDINNISLVRYHGGGRRE
jgi:hypothetical protein